ncbi:hypothetical protein BJ508DRAFT_326670 [Ascobolus immersus RN42]|uniref:Uncharacterized protein n=1 Tax=Ascobolus immersus RN42 TaxID=1160509 RepID=A0A3N4IAX2_ASCIM|nr:hypothetical protein BJ508DRAFT_326670 [Ascobolus immersus RN42]
MPPPATHQIDLGERATAKRNSDCGIHHQGPLNSREEVVETKKKWDNAGCLTYTAWFKPKSASDREKKVVAFVQELPLSDASKPITSVIVANQHRYMSHKSFLKRKPPASPTPADVQPSKRILLDAASATATAKRRDSPMQSQPMEDDAATGFPSPVRTETELCAARNGRNWTSKLTTALDEYKSQIKSQMEDGFKKYMENLTSYDAVFRNELAYRENVWNAKEESLGARELALAAAEKDLEEKRCRLDGERLLWKKKLEDAEREKGETTGDVVMWRKKYEGLISTLHGVIPGKEAIGGLKSDGEL